MRSDWRVILTPRWSGRLFVEGPQMEGQLKLVVGAVRKKEEMSSFGEGLMLAIT